jgi:hypothetical protein
LPVRKIGRRLKVHVIDLADWIDAQRPSGSEPQGGAPQALAAQPRLAAAGGRRTGVRPAAIGPGAGSVRGTANGR